MTKLNLLTLALTALSLSACGGKDAADKVANALTVTPTPAVQPATPTAVKWSGLGSLAMTGSPDTACSAVNLEILEDAGSYELSKFSYECNGMTADMQAIRMQLRGGELFLGADKVGKKQDNKTEFELRDPSGATLGFRFVITGDILQLEHTMKANGFSELLTATLKR